MKFRSLVLLLVLVGIASPFSSRPASAAANTSGSITCATNTTDITVTVSYANAPNGAILYRDGRQIASFKETTRTNNIDGFVDGAVAQQGISYVYRLQGGGRYLGDPISCSLKPMPVAPPAGSPTPEPAGFIDCIIGRDANNMPLYDRSHAPAWCASRQTQLHVDAQGYKLFSCYVAVGQKEYHHDDYCKAAQVQNHINSRGQAIAICHYTDENGVAKASPTEQTDAWCNSTKLLVQRKLNVKIATCKQQRPMLSSATGASNYACTYFVQGKTGAQQDGVYGAVTKASVGAYQDQHQLGGRNVTHGSVDKCTWQAMVENTVTSNCKSRLVYCDYTNDSGAFITDTRITNDQCASHHGTASTRKQHGGGGGGSIGGPVVSDGTMLNDDSFKIYADICQKSGMVRATIGLSSSDTPASTVSLVNSKGASSGKASLTWLGKNSLTFNVPQANSVVIHLSQAGQTKTLAVPKQLATCRI